MLKSSNDVSSNYTDNKSPETTSPLEGALSGNIHQALRNISRLPKQGQPLPQQNSEYIHPALRFLNLPPKTDKPSPLPSSTGACRSLPNMFQLSAHASPESLRHPSLSYKNPPSKIHSSSPSTILHGQRHPSTIDNHSPLKNQRFFCQDNLSDKDSSVDSDFDHNMLDNFTIIKSTSPK